MPVPWQLLDPLCLLAAVLKQRADAEERNESAAPRKQVVGTGVPEVGRPVGCCVILTGFGQLGSGGEQVFISVHRTK